MAVGTILSRITGFFRAILGVAVLGTALLADTYNVANTMPNILYNLLVGGALTAILFHNLFVHLAMKMVATVLHPVW